MSRESVIVKWLPINTRVRIIGHPESGYHLDKVHQNIGPEVSANDNVIEYDLNGPQQLVYFTRDVIPTSRITFNMPQGVSAYTYNNERRTGSHTFETNVGDRVVIEVEPKDNWTEVVSVGGTQGNRHEFTVENENPVSIDVVTREKQDVTVTFRSANSGTLSNGFTERTTTYNRNGVSETAVPGLGEFEGWYLNEEFVSGNTDLILTEWTNEHKTYVARFTLVTNQGDGTDHRAEEEFDVVVTSSGNGLKEYTFNGDRFTQPQTHRIRRGSNVEVIAFAKDEYIPVSGTTGGRRYNIVSVGGDNGDRKTIDNINNNISLEIVSSETKLYRYDFRGFETGGSEESNSIINVEEIR